MSIAPQMPVQLRDVDVQLNNRVRLSTRMMVERVAAERQLSLRQVIEDALVAQYGVELGKGEAGGS